MKSLVLSLAVIAVFAGVQAELKSVAILFRHGERTPASTMPKYGDSEIYRDLGAGQLTLHGSKQCYENGVDLRNRYLSLLPTHGYFRDSNMKLTSSSVPRCITSLTSFMAGFLPPPATDKTIPFKWQAMPFAVDNEARILTIDPSKCPAFMAAFTKQMASADSDPKLKQWIAEDEAILKKVGDFVGQPLTAFYDIFMAAETIRTQQFLDPNMPSWLITAYAQLQRYFEHYADLYHATEDMKTMRGGPMITEVIDNMVAMRDGNSTARNVVIFSAHDFTLVSMLSVLGVKNQAPKVAAYADTIAIEMHQNGRAEPEVQVLYISSTLPFKFKIQLHVPGCGTPCRLSTFNSLMAKYIVRDWEQICGLK